MTEPETTEAKSVEFCGSTFRLNPDVSEWALLEFAAATDEGLDAGSMRGLAAMFRFVVELIHPDDQDQFRAVARKNRVTGEQLFALLSGKSEADTERPTGRSGDSSPGPTTTEPKSDPNSGGSTSPTSGDQFAARPDLRLMIAKAKAA